MNSTPVLSLRHALAITFVLATVIAYGTLYPGAMAPALARNDEVLHFFAFAGLSMPISLARPRLAFYVILMTLLYGGMIELIQPLVGRDLSVLDMVADVLGAGVAIGLNRLLRKLRGTF